MNPFEVSITLKNEVLVVQLKGILDKSTIDSLKPYIEEIGGSSFKLAVLDVQGVPTMDYPGISEFIRFQKTVRDKPSKIRVSGVTPELKRLLEERGAIRPGEFSKDLIEAVQTLSKEFQKTS